MRFAIIDLGTNSVRFDVHQVDPDGSVRELHREKIMVRLGQNVFTSRKLDPAAVRRTLSALTRFKKIANDLKAEKITAFATSALREASDQRRFLELIRARAGIEVQVISGVEEAKLIALGILTNEKLGKERVALIDIGGGSTEISICKDNEVLHSWSLPMGTARLQQVFLKKTPPRPESIEELRQYLRNTFHDYIESDGFRVPKVQRIVGSSGTIRSLGKIFRKMGTKGVIERGKLSELIEEMSGMSAKQLLGIPGLEAKRLDMILGGSILFEECMRFLDCKKAATTEFTLRDGILEEEVRLVRQGKTSHLSLHVADLYAKAAQFGINVAHAKRVVRMGEELFQRLRHLHGLGPQWQIYLTAALILRDIGEKISLSRQEHHSYYIIRNTDLPPMERWELEFIARLCLYHEGGKVEAKDLPFRKDRARLDAFMKILSVLQILDALDSGPDTKIRLLSVRLAGKRARLRFAGSGLTGAESLNVDLRKSLFRETFRYDVEAERG